MNMNLNRLSRVREEMKQLNLDHLIVSSPDAIFYLLDKEIHPGERMLTLSISENKCTLILSALFPIENAIDFEYIHFDDTEDPVKILANGLHKEARVGIDKDWPSRFLLKLMKYLPDCQYENGSLAIDRVRLCKDSIELERMRIASEVNDRVMLKVMDYIQTNAPKHKITETEMQKKVIEFNEAFGAREMSFTPTICFGKNGAEPHHDCDETSIQLGDTVVVDIGNRMSGYCSDMTRSFVYGTPDAEYIKIYNLVLEANRSAISMVKPGTPLSEIDKAARDVIESAGYGAFFTHRTGHGIGINVHEFPDVSQSSDQICMPGMVFSIEPGIYLLGKYGVRIEDLVIVTEDGCEVINRVDKSLIQI